MKKEIYIEIIGSTVIENQINDSRYIEWNNSTGENKSLILVRLF